MCVYEPAVSGCRGSGGKHLSLWIRTLRAGPCVWECLAQEEEAFAGSRETGAKIWKKKGKVIV